MVANRKYNSRIVNGKVERVVYKIDKDGNFTEGKESMRTLYDANFREGKKSNRKSKKDGRR